MDLHAAMARVQHAWCIMQKGHVKLSGPNRCKGTWVKRQHNYVHDQAILNGEAYSQVQRMSCNIPQETDGHAVHHLYW